MVDPSLTIFQRMAAIVAQLPAIGKGQKNTQQGFMYRGHDDVMNALNPLLSKFEVFALPDVVERITDQRTTKSGTVMYEVNLHVRYRFYGPNGDFVEASAWGEGTDSGDKATNKAMTMALKNVIAQSFAVSTEERALLDTDAHSDAATVKKEPGQGKPGASRARSKPEAKQAASEPDAATPDDEDTGALFASKEERKELFDLKNAIGIPDGRLREILKQVTGQETTAGIPADLFDAVKGEVIAEGAPFQ